MRKFTLIFSLMMAMFTTAMAQESVNLATGTFGGETGDKDTFSQWTSENGVSIISADANNVEVASMKYYNNQFQIIFNENVSTPIKYTITAPEGYSLTEMKVKNSTKSHNAWVDYDLRSYLLNNKLTEETITFTEGKNLFEAYGQVGFKIYITSLTITKDVPSSISEVETETEQTIYDLTGRRVETITERGIYVVNGKKVLVK